MGWQIEFSAASILDFELIFDHLFESYTALGESVSEAATRAAARVEQIEAEAQRLVVAPYSGEAHDEMLPNRRHITLGRAIYWFVPDEATQAVRILAIFYGGQNHRLHMLTRLLSEE